MGNYAAMNDVDLEKTCSKCGLVKPLDQFYKKSKSKDGHASKCVDCTKLDKKAYYAKNAEKIRAQTKAYYLEHSEERIAYQKSYARENVELLKEKRSSRYWNNREADLAQQRLYRQRNAEKLSRKWAEYRKSNSQKRAQYCADWRRANPEKQAAAKRAWKQANPELNRAHEALRRARLRSVPAIEFTVEQLAQRWAYYGDKCWICREEATATDHVKPIAKGGAHMLCNLRPICTPCNSSKRDTWPYTLINDDPAAAA